MPEKKLDRRVQRTRQLLNDSLMQLIQEKGYDNVTIEDITERANLGRTTFYLHYQSKDDLLLDHHEHFASQINLGMASRDQLLGLEPEPALVEFLTRLSQAREIYNAFAHARDSVLIMRRLRDRAMRLLEESLLKAFPDSVPSRPLPLLTRFIVEGEFALLEWWLKTRSEVSAQELAENMQQMRASIVRDAYGVEREM